MSRHRYEVDLKWQGNKGSGTSGYAEYSRDYVIQCEGKPDISGSSDPAFRGDSSRWNPEELFLASVSACHKLWYLHLAADAGVTVTHYHDRAVGTMGPDDDGAIRFLEITLMPTVTITGNSDEVRAKALHHDANRACFIANSLAVPVKHQATIEKR